MVREELIIVASYINLANKYNLSLNLYDYVPSYRVSRTELETERGWESVRGPRPVGTHGH